jgi:hypothetical protein
MSVETNNSWRSLIGPGLALFGSSTTLICCALPALLVSIGMGAAVAGLVSAVPQITLLAAHKNYVFAISGLILALAGFATWAARNDPCPVDKQAALACRRMRAASVWLLGLACAAWFVGAFFAFFAAELFFPKG